ncbi:hypothetical protein PSI19_21795, partial [Xenorhabdus khoisanae]|nr:hypothetical protein [Xenorhabdus khoisanae]
MTALNKSMAYGNRLKNKQTPYLAFGHTLTAPIISGQLLNPLIFNHTANMQSGHNMRVSFSDAQKEKDSTANATLWDHAYLRHEINQSV